MLIGHNTSGILSLDADEAIAPSLRVKWGATPGKTVAIAAEVYGVAFSATTAAPQQIDLPGLSD